MLVSIIFLISYNLFKCKNVDMFSCMFVVWERYFGFFYVCFLFLEKKEVFFFFFKLKVDDYFIFINENFCYYIIKYL